MGGEVVEEFGLWFCCVLCGMYQENGMQLVLGAED